MYSYTIRYNWNIYQKPGVNYHVDNKDYFWIITWISEYYYVILYNKQQVYEAFAPQLQGP